jgi:hypothetical protein
LLIQGSVQPPPVSIKREDWESAMWDVGAKTLGPEWSEWKPDQELAARVEELARQKYCQKNYNEKR